MSSQNDGVEAVIRVTLREMTAGSPSGGLRGRVLARISGVSNLDREAHGWLGSVRWAALVVPLEALGVIGVVAALVLPQLLRHGQTTQPLARQGSGAAIEMLSSPKARSDDQPGAYASTASATMAGKETVQPVAPDVPGRTRVSARDVRRVPSAGRPWPADNASTESTIVVIAPLGEPAPIAVRPITLTPLEFQHVTIDEIEIPLLESNRPPRNPGQPDWKEP